MNGLFTRLPNLLDSRVRDGDGEEDNEVVFQWGEEHRKSGEVRSTSSVGHTSASQAPRRSPPWYQALEDPRLGFPPPLPSKAADVKPPAASCMSGPSHLSP